MKALFILLHYWDNSPVILNINDISLVTPNLSHKPSCCATELYLISSPDSAIKIKETPEQILDLIKQANEQK